MQSTPTGLAVFDCYRIRNNQTLNVCFVTLVAGWDGPVIVSRRTSFGVSAHLGALLGHDKLYDPAYRSNVWR